VFCARDTENNKVSGYLMYIFVVAQLVQVVIKNKIKPRNKQTNKNGEGHYNGV